MVTLVLFWLEVPPLAMKHGPKSWLKNENLAKAATKSRDARVGI